VLRHLRLDRPRRRREDLPTSPMPQRHPPADAAKVSMDAGER
jgi:hypothetical protein